MITQTTSFRGILAGSLLALIVFGCVDDEERGSLNDITLPTTSAPTVTSISPAGSALAGLDTLTITGTNFSSTTSDNTVYFIVSGSATTGSIIQASATQLQVRAPLVVDTSVVIRVAKQGSDQLSPSVTYRLDAAVSEFGSLSPAEWARGITTDAAGNLYVAVTQEGTADLGISMYTPAGVRSQYAPATPGASQWGALKWGPTGVIYAGRNVRAVYSYAAGGGAAASLWKAFAFGNFIFDFDFDSNQNLWSVGNNSQIHVVKTDLSLISTAFDGNIRSARVYNGYLYFSGTVPTITDTVSKVWRATITGDVLGTPEIFFDFAGAYGATRNANCITFANDGTMFIGTESPEGVVVRYPSGAYGSPYGTYSAAFGTSIQKFAWGSGDALYATTLEGGLVVIATRLTSATYYGTQ